MPSRASALDDIGDPDAPPGSRPWASAVRLQMQSLIKDSESSAKHLDVYRKAMEKHEGWRKLTDQDGLFFSSFDEFCEAPVPWGLGHPKETVDRIIVERLSTQQEDVLDQARQRGNGRPAKDNEKETFDNVQGFRVDAPTGNSRRRALRKLRAEAENDPAVAALRDDVLAGKISPNAAMIEAGFRQKTITVPLDPERAAQTLMRHFTRDECMAIGRRLLGELL